MKKKIAIGVILGIALGVTSANAAYNQYKPRLLFTDKDLQKAGLYRYCEDGNLIYLYFNESGLSADYGRNSMAVVPKGCVK